VVETAVRKVSCSLGFHLKVVLPPIKQWPGRLFKIPTAVQWIVVLTEPQFIEDVRNAPDHLLSAHEANNEVGDHFFR